MDVRGRIAYWRDKADKLDVEIAKATGNTEAVRIVSKLLGAMFALRLCADQLESDIENRATR